MDKNMKPIRIEGSETIVYCVHDTWGARECAEILRALHGKFTVDEWVAALEASKKHYAEEVGTAGGVTFMRIKPRWMVWPLGKWDERRWVE